MESNTQYPNVLLRIGGEWRPGSDARRHSVIDPFTGSVIKDFTLASRDDLEAAVQSASDAFAAWRQAAPTERSKLLRRTADLLRQRADGIADLITREQGKRLSEARLEVLGSAEVVEWFAEEGRRMYGRVVPGRGKESSQLVTREPVGIVAAFTPWNFPINQAVRKIAAALAAGCSIIVKGPEEAPASVAALVQVFLDAGIPSGVVNLVYGVPAEVSNFLIAHPLIRKVSFTGSTAVGKHLAALAGQHMKRVSMELGGHAPAIVCDDADLDLAVKLLCVQKFWNAGQACISPSRFLVQEAVYAKFVDKFVAAAKAVRVGSGLDKSTRMGPLANARRAEAMTGFVADAVQKGARVELGGSRSGQQGFMFEPTVLSSVSQHARLWNEEPFGPVAAIAPFDAIDDAIAEANRLPYALAAYGFTRSGVIARRLAQEVETGMLAINSISLGLPEMPFGGIKDSGYGSEGGAEALESYLNTKLVVHASV
ncbi:Alpha-ketoglutaric semialdehyde dehydrogenase 1 [Cupriavidus laharis]|uniref:Alpha-ketoglutaric semialdehyde dehydrogenase 1 n=1 Tax=Cupriavidus laharis TaxID=151654 RepID=A0ABN7Y8I2_9BURK|nr:NAD-dependent succinate-semialdehyde dehydrogenase [Cupriavidus laharis]CAG9169086.1 Alpha-ketoglutaric semialdehyde dehydrogenase 1 [Cupriavidus laharis]